MHTAALSFVVHEVTQLCAYFTQVVVEVLTCYGRPWNSPASFTKFAARSLVLTLSSDSFELMVLQKAENGMMCIVPEICLN